MIHKPVLPASPIKLDYIFLQSQWFFQTKIIWTFTAAVTTAIIFQRNNFAHFSFPDISNLLAWSYPRNLVKTATLD